VSNRVSSSIKKEKELKSENGWLDLGVGKGC
jgi:hypothetical protein